MDCLITSTVRLARDKTILGYQGIIRDISELVSGRRQLEKTLKELREALGGTIEAMALTVETRDPYTAGHQRRVSNLARAIATEMGISEDQIQGIRLAGVIHDIGKISVPGEILSKPGKISKNEFGIIKVHPQVGHNILNTVDFPWPIAQIVLQHHERMDGSGYPDGISGENIILEARILAVADVVEAMASHRPYRASLGIDIALREILKNRGSFYDPKVVDACLRLFNEKDYRL
jgi:putative nucleotidyltransferase with HDIG domain